MLITTPKRFRLQDIRRWGPGEVHRGGRLEGEAGEAVNQGSIDSLRGQRLPYADFFGYFLVQRQESNTLRCLLTER